MRLTACDIWLEKACCCVAATRFVICSSDENCAIWPMKSLSSIGFIGSWCCSCVTSSFRKSSLPSVVPDVSCCVAPASGVLDDVCGTLFVTAPSSCQHVDLRPGVGQPRRLDRDLRVLAGIRAVLAPHQLRLGCAPALVAVRLRAVSCRPHVEAEQVHALRLECPAQVAARGDQRLRRVG